MEIVCRLLWRALLPNFSKVFILFIYLLQAFEPNDFAL